MNIDWSASAAWIVLGATIVSPIVVAVINNRHQRKMYILRKRDEAKTAAINEYLSSLSNVIYAPTPDALKKYCAQYGLVTGYIPDDTMDDVDIMHQMVLDAGRSYGSSDIHTNMLYGQYRTVRDSLYHVLTEQTAHMR